MRQIPPRYTARVWGTRKLTPWFSDPEVPTGEVSFDVSPEFPLLVKFIFTEERLSIQVHPGDAYARTHANARGKTEMWHILAAADDARIALGFNAHYTGAQVREAVQSRTIEDLVNWIPVHPGETYYAPAGTVHAIGAGLKLCEIQQNSDVTYRLYDYGRPRELHLEDGLSVAKFQPFDGRRSLPLHCEHFTTEELSYTQPITYLPQLPRDHLLIILDGSASLAGQELKPGQVWHIPKDSPALALIPSAGLRMLRTY